MAKRLDPKAKAKRDKIIAGVAGLVLLGVLAFAIPMTMKQMKSQNVPAAAAAAVTTSTTTPAATASLASSGGTSTVALGQLGSLGRFDSKDPFAQQVDPHAVVVLVGKLPGPAGRSTRSGAPSASSSSPPPPRVAPPPTSAVITVNGGPPQKISVGQDFPLAPFDPLFHLASVSRGVARISIAGGSLSDGRATVKLRKGHPLTLQNDADGTQYVLRLLWTGSGVPPTSVLPPAPAAGSPTATTPSAVTPPTGAAVTTTTGSP